MAALRARERKAASLIGGRPVRRAGGCGTGNRFCNSFTV